MTLAIPRLLIGRTIVAADLRPFPDGRGGKAYRPILTLDNGALLTFEVVETDSTTFLDGIKETGPAEYGVRPEYRAGSAVLAVKPR